MLAIKKLVKIMIKMFLILKNVLRSQISHQIMKKIKKYKAAYLDKNAKPRKIPTNKDEKLEFCLNEINKKQNRDK